MLDENQFEKLATLLSSRLESVVTAQFDKINRKLDSIQNSCDLQASNTDEDRNDFAQMKINQASIDQGVKEIVAMLPQMGKRIGDKMVDQTNATMESAVDRVTESVEPVMQRAVNKLKNGIPLTKKKPFWKIWG